jgi:hypothetical protein
MNASSSSSRHPWFSIKEPPKRVTYLVCTVAKALLIVHFHPIGIAGSVRRIWVQDKGKTTFVPGDGDLS